VINQPEGFNMMKRRRVKHSDTLEDRLANEARRLKTEADGLSPGKERDELLRKATQAETALEMTSLLTQRPPPE
jgi:hypothetical protein